MRKKIQEIFSQHGLKTTAEAINCKIVNFLDLTLNLEDESFKIYGKPSNVPLYVHRMSNHPPTVLKNLPRNVNQRLSNNSSNEQLFNDTVAPFQEAITKSGYDFKLKFDPLASNPKPKSKNRKRNILWFNPLRKFINLDHEGALEGPFLPRVLQNLPRRIHFGVHDGPGGSSGPW